MVIAMNESTNNTNISDNKESLIRYVISLADDAVILGQRLSELCSNGPYLEEDLATSNVALDYIGRASMFYQYAAELKGDGCDEDQIAFLRDERQFTNLLINELPNGDFAFTMVKQFYIDAFNCLFLPLLCNSDDTRISEIAAKSVKESRYHLKRSVTWIKKLAGGTDESLRRTELAIEELRSFVGELFDMQSWEQELADSGIAVDRTALREQWDTGISELFSECQLSCHFDETQIIGGRDGIHTEHLGHLLSEMQFIQRSYPGLSW